MKRSLSRQLRDRAVIVRQRQRDPITAQMMEDAAEKILDLLARLETLERRAKIDQPPKAKHVNRVRENTEYLKALRTARLKRERGRA